MKKLTIFLLCSLMSFVVVAETAVPTTKHNPSEISPEKKQLLRKALSSVISRAPDSISESEFPGFYEAFYGSQVIFVSTDGGFAIEGNVFDLTRRINLTKASREKVEAEKIWPIIKTTIAKTPDNRMLVYKAPKEQHVVTIFTDVDCYYCQKLHAEMSDYQSQGITVRYMFFPRAGLRSKSYDKVVSVWCADNPLEALTQAKLKRKIPEKSCENPVKDHYQTGQMIGVSGTPAIVLSSGQLLSGYLPAKKLKTLLESAN
jgi:thiol:disulfide interchange protein DsbC